MIPPAIPQPGPPAIRLNDGYEFDEDESDHFRELVSAMRFVSTGTLAVAGLLVAFVVLLATRFTLAFVAPIALMVLINAGCLGVIGAMHRGAALALSRVYDTEGRDIAHLMDGMTRLRGLYRFLMILLLVVLVVGVVIPMGLAVVGAVLALARH